MDNVIDKLENALYVLLQEHINKNNYESFNKLLREIKKIKNENDDVKNVKTYLKQFLININDFSLEYNDILENIITKSYNVSPFNTKKMLDFNSFNTLINKFKLTYLKENNINVLSKPITIKADDVNDLNFITTKELTTFYNNIKTLINEISISNILSVIFKSGFNFNTVRPFTDKKKFSELTIPVNIMNVINDTKNNDNINLELYKMIYNTLINYLNDNSISDIDVLNFINEYIKHIDIKNINISLNDINIKEKLKVISLDDNGTKLSDNINITNLNLDTFNTWNNNLVLNLIIKLNIPDNISEINSYLKDKKITLFNNLMVYSFETILTDMCSESGMFILELTPDKIKKLYQNFINSTEISKQYNFIFDKNFEQINSLLKGIISDLNKSNIFNNINDINDINKFKELFSNLLSNDNAKINDFLNSFKNNYTITDILDNLYDAFNNSGNKFIQLYYAMIYSNKKINN